MCSDLCRCLAHVVNLGNVDLMKNITQIAAVETAIAIWEYDPTLPDNRILDGSLDVIAAIWTLVIKVRLDIVAWFQISNKPYFRSMLLDNELSTFTVPRHVVESQSP